MQEWHYPFKSVQHRSKLPQKRRAGGFKSVLYRVKCFRFSPLDLQAFALSKTDLIPTESYIFRLLGYNDVGRDLVDRLSQPIDFKGRAEITNATLCDMLKLRTQKGQRILAIANSVAGRKTKSHEIASSLKLSERSFRRHWAELVGIEHRMFMSLMRFHRAVAMIDGGFELSAVAFECGYADQPHLARDVKRLSGLPAMILKKRLGDEVYNALFKNRHSAPWTLG